MSKLAYLDGQHLDDFQIRALRQELVKTGLVSGRDVCISREKSWVLTEKFDFEHMNILDDFGVDELEES